MASLRRWLWRTWRDPLHRAALVLAVLTLSSWVLLMGSPNFTNASQGRFFDPTISLQFARNVDDVDLVLGEAPSIDRETMRIKTEVDFAFLTAYSLLLAVSGWIVMRHRGWRSAAGIVIFICGLGAGAFDVLENLAILEILDTPLKFTTQAMINAIRGPAVAKWSLVGVAVALLAASKIARKS